MKILQVNKYLFKRDGVTTVLEETIQSLKKRGHQISLFGQNDPGNFTKGFRGAYIKPVYFDSTADSLPLKLSALLRMFSGYGSLKILSEFLDKVEIDIAHLHNIYHHISPLVIGLLKKRGIPVVMTLHDYKVFCPCYLFLRQHKGSPKPCTYCVKNGPFGVVRHRCIRNSAMASLICYFEALIFKRFYSQVDCFISPSNFIAEKAIAKGIAPSKISVIRNPAPLIDSFPDNNTAEGSCFPKPVILFLGRLYPEKGAETLLRAFAYLRHDRMRLVIAGEGPEKIKLQRLAQRLDLNVRFPGFLSGKEKQKAITEAMALVFPSHWYENCPMSILEAFSIGKPVIASRIGGIPEIVEDGRTGLLVKPGSVTDLAKAIHRLFNDFDLAKKITKKGKKKIKTDFNPEIYGEQLEELYLKFCTDS